MDSFKYFFAWGNNAKRRELKGKLCRVLFRTKTMNSCLIEFKDGSLECVSRNAIRKTKPYRPSNSDEGEWFQEKFCDKCDRERFNPDSGKGRQCSILNRALIFTLADGKDYPEEWVSINGKPYCSAFRLPKPRRKPEPKSKDQLTFI